MAKVTRSTAGAKHVANKEKFNGANYTTFEFTARPSKGRAERLAMKQRLAEAKAILNSPEQPVTAGFVEVKFAYSI